MKQSRFCLIIPVLQTEKILRLFIDSLFKSLQYTSTIIFVDDGSSQASKNILLESKNIKNEFVARIEIIENEKPLGCAKSINKALTILPDCDIVTFLDSDLILTENWQKYVLESFKNQNVGIVGGMLLYPQTNGIQCCGITFNNSVGRHLFLNNKPEIIVLNEDFEIQATVFAFCNIKYSAVKNVGNLDERFFNGYEDWDYQFRIRRQGWLAVTNPKIRIYHWETSCGPHRTFNRKSNLGLFWSKHSIYVQNDISKYIVESIVFLRDKYIVIDLCEGRAEIDVIKQTLIDANIISEYLDFSYIVSQEAIWLPQVFNSTFYLNNRPIIYLVDNFLKLLDNQYWWSLRSNICNKDVIVDLYGNVLPFKVLSQCFWPGSKIR